MTSERLDTITLLQEPLPTLISRDCKYCHDLSDQCFTYKSISGALEDEMKQRNEEFDNKEKAMLETISQYKTELVLQENKLHIMKMEYEKMYSDLFATKQQLKYKLADSFRIIENAEEINRINTFYEKELNISQLNFKKMVETITELERQKHTLLNGFQFLEQMDEIKALLKKHNFHCVGCSATNIEGNDIFQHLTKCLNKSFQNN